MINVLILNDSSSETADLKNIISNFFPQASFTVSNSNHEDWSKFIQETNPELVFLEVESRPATSLEILKQSQHQSFEIILLSSKRTYLFDAIKYRISGYLLKPINSEALKKTLSLAIQRIQKKKETKSKRSSLTNLSTIGIPTMEGYEFLNIDNIVRCESYLKCTRVITNDRSDIISSYNIGEFIKAMENHNFYRPHQSHLINLNKVQKYLKEGTIIMQDNSFVPVSRRKRNEFLKSIPHL